MLVASVAVSCQHKHDEHDHGHSHSHGVEMLVAYSADFELFAETEPFLVGKECAVAAHITRLADFKPLDSTQVTLVFDNGGQQQRQTLKSPHEAGIYRFSITPVKAGCADMTFEIEVGDSVALLKAPHVHVYADHDALHHHDGCGHDHETPEGDLVSFTKEQSWKTDFATEVVCLEEFGQLIRTVAQVLPSQGNERQVVAMTSGIVALNANMVEGVAVNGGQTLFSIESNGMADNNMGVRYQEAVANYNLAKETYERKQRLAADKIVSTAELQRAKSEYENAMAVYNNLKHNFSTSGQRATAPMGGYVKALHVANGAFVEAGQPVMTVAQNRDLFIRAEVQPRHYEALSLIEDVTFKTSHGNNVYSLKDLNGSVVSYGRAVDEGSPLLPVTFRVRNSANLVSGDFLTIYIRCRGSEPVLTVANGGIVEEMGNYFVYVQHNPEQFEKRLVTLGATDGLRTVVLSGLKAKERVVSKGAMMIKLNQSSGALDPHAGHVH